MDGMFRGASAFNTDISWDVSKVTDMDSMFDGTTSFNADISKWDVSKVTYTKSLITQFPSRWQTTDMKRMFQVAMTVMREMFEHSSAFNVDISKWDVSKVTRWWSWVVLRIVCSTRQLPSTQTSPVGIDVSNTKDMSRMFYGTTSSNTDISKWDVFNVKHMDTV